MGDFSLTGAGFGAAAGLAFLPGSALFGAAAGAGAGGLLGGLFGSGDKDRDFTPSAKIEMTPGGKRLETSLYESLKTDLFPENLASKFIGDAKKMLQARKKIATRGIVSPTGPEDVVSGDIAKSILAETSTRFAGAPTGPRKVGQAKRAFSIERLGKLQKFINLQAQAPILQAQADLISKEIEQSRGARKGAKIGSIAQMLALTAT
jgi:hypothetical protein